jgi:RNA polymerase sigma-70 factor (ECF subfamily)
VTGNGHDAEDASQLVFLALAMQIKSGTSIRQLSGWLQQVSRRQGIKIVRSQGRRRRREEAARKPELHASNGHDQLDADVIAGIVRDAIDQLPETYRLPLILHYFGGMNLERIATELKAKRPAIATRLHRGRKMLGKHLTQRGIKMEDAALGSLLAVLVPAEVISRLASSAGKMTLTPEASHAAMLPLVITRTLRAVAYGALHRPIITLALALTLISGASGMTWAIRSGVIDFHPLRDINLREQLQNLLPRVQPAPRVDATPPPAPAAPDAKSAVVFSPPTHPALTSTPSRPTIPESPGIVIPAPSDLDHPSAPSAPPPAPRVSPPIAHSQPALPSAPLARTAAALNLNPAPSLDVGRTGNENLTLGSDTHLSIGEFRIGVASGAQGAVTQTGGDVSAQRLTIADAGRGTYDLRDGKLNVGALVIGAKPGSVGKLRVQGGEVFLGAGGAVVGAGGSGTLVLGNETIPGEIHASGAGGAPFVIAQAATAQGVVQGWGSIDTGGELLNNGQVIADGHGHSRSLNLAAFDSVSSTYAASTAPRGWFVQAGGRVTLPPLSIEPGTNTYTWGDRNDTPALDLINSLRLRVHDQPTATSVSISLRTIAQNDPLDIALPGRTSIVGLWQLDHASAFEPSAIDVIVRYNAAATDGMVPGEESLQMFAYDQGEWHIADNLSRDQWNDFVAGQFNGAFDYLAVGVPWDPAAIAMSSSSPVFLEGVTPTPEPAGILIGLAGGAWILFKRRRSLLG